MTKKLHRYRYLPAPSHGNYQFSVICGRTGRSRRVGPNDEFVCDPKNKDNARILGRVAERVPGLAGSGGTVQACLLDLGPLEAPKPVRRAPPPKPAEGEATPSTPRAPVVEERDPLEPPKPYENKPAHVTFAKSLGLEVEGMTAKGVIKAYTAELKRRHGEVEEESAVQPETVQPEAAAPVPMVDAAPEPAAPAESAPEQPAPTEAAEQPAEG